MENKSIKFVIITVIAIAIVCMINPFVIIRAGHRGVVLNWGAVSNDVLNEGIHFRMPIKQSIQSIDVQMQKEQVDSSASSKDLQIVTSKIALNYHLDPDKVNQLWQKIGSSYKERIIDPAIQEAVKASTAKYTAEELITKRDQVKEEIKTTLKDRLQNEFIMVDEFSIVNFDFSQSFNAAIEQKVTAEQNALAAKNKLEQIKFEAEQRISQAKGEAEAIRTQAQSISQQGGAEYVRLKTIEKWDGKLPTQMIPGGTLPFINITQ